MTYYLHLHPIFFVQNPSPPPFTIHVSRLTIKKANIVAVKWLRKINFAPLWQPLHC